MERKPHVAISRSYGPVSGWTVRPSPTTSHAEEIHGAWLTEELARHGYRISPGTLYPTLHRLEADGLLVSEQRVVGGRVRRVYRATEDGKRALAEDREALAELAREVLGNDAL
jgi:DNA-binding PadR family transcriptional regulator